MTPSCLCEPWTQQTVASHLDSSAGQCSLFWELAQMICSANHTLNTPSGLTWISEHLLLILVTLPTNSRAACQAPLSDLSALIADAA